MLGESLRGRPLYQPKHATNNAIPKPDGVFHFCPNFAVDRNFGGIFAFPNPDQAIFAVNAPNQAISRALAPTSG